MKKRVLSMFLVGFLILTFSAVAYVSKESWITNGFKYQSWYYDSNHYYTCNPDLLCHNASACPELNCGGEPFVIDLYDENKTWIGNQTITPLTCEQASIQRCNQAPYGYSNTNWCNLKTPEGYELDTMEGTNQTVLICKYKPIATEQNNTCETSLASIFIKPYYPKGRSYVFVCTEKEEFVPITYVWSFGDGTSQAGGNEVYHKYKKDGVYTVRCFATDTINFAAGNLTVNVKNR